MTPAAEFVRDLRAHPLLASTADDVERVLSALDIEADGSPHALQFHAGVEWILKQKRTPEEKLEALRRLGSLEGKVTVDMKALTGW